MGSGTMLWRATAIPLCREPPGYYEISVMIIMRVDMFDRFVEGVSR